MAVPNNTVAPAFTGVARLGLTIAGDPGTWTGSPTFAYQCQRSEPVTHDGAYVLHEGEIVNGDWEDVAGATNIDRVLQAADFGKFVRNKVTGTNGEGSEIAFSNRVGPVMAGGGGGGGGLGGVGMGVSSSVVMLEEDDD